MELVKTNPNAPDNEQKKTHNINNRSQQSSTQKEAVKEIDLGNPPTLKGGKMKDASS